MLNLPLNAGNLAGLLVLSSRDFFIMLITLYLMIQRIFHICCLETVFTKFSGYLKTTLFIENGYSYSVTCVIISVNSGARIETIV